MADSTISDTKWSGKKKEEGDQQDAVRTLECLRGRLLAERSASKAAKQDADTMAKKLQDLEEKLRVEAKAKRRAEKKLNLLKKRLESLNITHICEDSAAEQQSSSSDNFESSIITSSTTDPDEIELKSETTKDSSAKSGNSEQAMVQSVSSDSCVKCHERPIFEDPFGEKMEIEERCVDSRDVSEDPFDETLEIEGDFGSSCLSIEGPSCEEVELREKSPDSEVECSRSTISSTNDQEKDEANSKSNKEDDSIADNSMALIPITSLTTSETKLTNQQAREVLDTLRQLIEYLQSSTESMRLVKVG